MSYLTSLYINTCMVEYRKQSMTTSLEGSDRGSHTTCTGSRQDGCVKLSRGEVALLHCGKCDTVSLGGLSAQGKDLGGRRSNQCRSVNSGRCFVSDSELSICQFHAQLGAHECVDSISNGGWYCAWNHILSGVHESEVTPLHRYNWEKGSEKSSGNCVKLHDVQ